MKHAKWQQIALERIYRLFELAQQELEKHPQRSKRYVNIALEISKKARARIPDELKTSYCKSCHAYLADGKNADVKKIGRITFVKCRGCGFERKTGRKRGGSE